MTAQSETYCNTSICGPVLVFMSSVEKSKPSVQSLSFQANILRVQDSDNSCNGRAVMLALPYL